MCMWKVVLFCYKSYINLCQEHRVIEELQDRVFCLFNVKESGNNQSVNLHIHFYFFSYAIEFMYTHTNMNSFLHLFHFMFLFIYFAMYGEIVVMINTFCLFTFFFHLS